MFRCANRAFLATISRHARRAFKSTLRSNRSDAQWMKRHQERQNRYARYRKAFAFVPLNFSRFKSMVAVFFSMFSKLSNAQPHRIHFNRSGMLGDRKGKRRGKSVRNKLATSSYQALEPRQLLAADIGIVNGNLTVVDTDNSVDQWTITSDGTDLTITDDGGGTFDLTGSLDGSAGDGTNQISIPLAEFAGGDLIVDGGGGDDSINLGATTLLSGQGLDVTGGDGEDSISITGRVETLGSSISLTATNDITVFDSIITNGGNQIITADSDGDGAGTLSLDFPIAELQDPNPSAGNDFGNTIVPLTSGNVVVTSPFDDAGGVDAGAVYLFNATTGELISTLTGSSDNDQVGNSGVTALSNGNYVVSSAFWANGEATNAGAVTWGDGTVGISGAVSENNSLVGTQTNDLVGNFGVTALSNGNYVVNSRGWNNGDATDAGAVTWGDGTVGISGAVSENNSLVGTQTNDFVGNFGVTALSNGNYVVNSRGWNNGDATDAGAVTWGDGCLLYTSPSPRDQRGSRMPSSA